MVQTRFATFSLRARAALPVVALSLASLATIHCGEDDPPAAPAAAGGSAAGTGGSNAGGGGASAGSGGSTGAAAGAGGTEAAGQGGTAGAGGAAPDPIEVTQNCVGKYVDLASKTEAERKIEAIGVAWTPNCVEITAGQALQWDVDFTVHPLRKGVTGNADAGTAGNPIPDTDGGAPLTVQFPNPGFYPFYCNYHATPDGKGMIGLVHVK